MVERLWTVERFRNQETKYIVVLLAFPGHTDVKDALILKFIDMDLENQLCSLSLTSQNWFQNSSLHLVMKAQNVNTSVQIQRKVAKKNSLLKKPMKNPAFTRKFHVLLWTAKKS